MRACLSVCAALALITFADADVCRATPPAGRWPGFERGIGMGGWLTNYKRFNVLRNDWRMKLTEGDFEHFETFITERDVAYVAKCGFDHIRLGFDQIVLEESSGKYRERTFRCVDNFVGWCRKHGLGVVLNLHKAIGNYCDIPGGPSLMDEKDLQDRFVALWLEFERRYHDDRALAFELLNEVNSTDCEKWNALAERTVKAIRTVNAERTIVVGSCGGNYPQFLDRLRVFDDPHVVYTFHWYDPGCFTHQQGVLKEEYLYYNRKLSYPCDDVERYREFDRVVRGVTNSYAGVSRIDRRWMRRELDSAFRWQAKHPDKVLWAGEFGTIRHADARSRVAWMRDMVSICREGGFPYCVWNYLSTPNDGNRFSLVDDDTREFLSRDLLDACLGDRTDRTLVRSNESFTVTWNVSDGTLSSLVLNGDPDRMNWIEGTDHWGALRYHRMDIDWKGYRDTWGDTSKFGFEGLRLEGDAVVSVYTGGVLRAEVRREIKSDGLEETYSFTNMADWPVYFLRGHLGILATFNDSYAAASECETRRCHAHIWCGGENSWVRALKMGPYPTELALVLQKGDLDAYSVRRIAEEYSNDRGDFVLHPAPFSLKKGETKTIAWKLAVYPAGGFDETLLRLGGAKIAFRNETIFPDETFEIDVTGPDGRTTHHSRRPDRDVGTYDFEFDVGGRKAKARGYCSPKFGDLVDARVKFIVGKQQCLDPDSPLYGAYLIWDSEDNAPYFDYLWRDHNACRERVVMALTVARWLQRNRDPEVLRSLELFEAFVFREFFDEKSCTVYDTIGKNPRWKRLYNAPNLVQFWRELYALKGDSRYLDYIEKSILDYYRLGGAKFYPNGCDFSSELVLLERAGRHVPELRDAVRKHVANVTANGIRYPEHEVRFEQTIATPAVSMLAQYYRLIEKTPAVRAALEANYDVLSRFQGNQPDHKLDEIAIRHWDGYWFGKNHLYGDTLHQHSTITARAFLQYAAATGDGRAVARAERCLRNCLYMFRPDGSATCAYLLPLTVTMLKPDGTLLRATRRGEYADPFVNDMDTALYLAMRSGLFGAYGGPDPVPKDGEPDHKGRRVF